MKRTFASATTNAVSYQWKTKILVVYYYLLLLLIFITIIITKLLLTNYYQITIIIIIKKDWRCQSFIIIFLLKKIGREIDTVSVRRPQPHTTSL